MPAQNDYLGSPITAAAKPSVQAGRKHTHWRCGRDSRCVLLLLRADLLESKIKHEHENIAPAPALPAYMSCCS